MGLNPSRINLCIGKKDGAATVLRCECLSHERHIVFEELLVALLHEENEADMDDEETA